MGQEWRDGIERDHAVNGRGQAIFDRHAFEETF